jgi:hypothetical protein
MKTTTPMRLRFSRFLSERYSQRERPGSFAELFLLALIVITATWPIISLVHAVANGNWIGSLGRIWF